MNDKTSKNVIRVNMLQAASVCPGIFVWPLMRQEHPTGFGVGVRWPQRLARDFYREVADEATGIAAARDIQNDAFPSTDIYVVSLEADSPTRFELNPGRHNPRMVQSEVVQSEAARHSLGEIDFLRHEAAQEADADPEYHQDDFDDTDPFWNTGPEEEPVPEYISPVTVAEHIGEALEGLNMALDGLKMAFNLSGDWPTLDAELGKLIPETEAILKRVNVASNIKGELLDAKFAADLDAQQKQDAYDEARWEASQM